MKTATIVIFLILLLGIPTASYFVGIASFSFPSIIVNTILGFMVVLAGILFFFACLGLAIKIAE